MILRQYEDEDIAPLHPVFSAPETMKFFSIWRTQDWIKRNQDRYRNDGYGLWAVCLKETNEFIGDCGLVKQKINDSIEVEIGYHINKSIGPRGSQQKQPKRAKNMRFINWV